MKSSQSKTIKSLPLFLALVCCFQVFTSAAYTQSSVVKGSHALDGVAPLRSWTSGKGTKMEGRLIGFDGKIVILMTGAGKYLRFPPPALSSADQQYLNEWRKKSGDHWKSVPEMDYQIFTKAPHSISEGSSFTLLPVSDTKIQLDRKGQLKGEYKLFVVSKANDLILERKAANFNLVILADNIPDSNSGIAKEGGFVTFNKNLRLSKTTETKFTAVKEIKGDGRILPLISPYPDQSNLSISLQENAQSQGTFKVMLANKNYKCISNILSLDVEVVN